MATPFISLNDQTKSRIGLRTVRSPELQGKFEIEHEKHYKDRRMMQDDASWKLVVKNISQQKPVG